MSLGLAYRQAKKRTGGGCRTALRRSSVSTGARVAAEHISQTAIRWLAAESSGADPVDLLLAHEDEQTPQLSECVSAALGAAADQDRGTG